MRDRYVADLRSVLAESSFAEQKAYIPSFVKEIKVTGKEAVLTYTMPLAPEQTAEDMVLDNVQNGGPQRPIDRTFTLSFSLPRNPRQDSTIPKTPESR